MNRFVKVAHDGQERWGDQSSYRQNQNPGAEVIDIRLGKKKPSDTEICSSDTVADFTAYRVHRSLTSLRHR